MKKSACNEDNAGTFFEITISVQNSSIPCRNPTTDIGSFQLGSTKTHEPIFLSMFPGLPLCLEQ
jgi:hypothetical protein